MRHSPARPTEADLDAAFGPLHSAATDGLELSPNAVRDLQDADPALFARLFDVARIADVPVIGVDGLVRPRRNSAWYVRLRRATADRRRDAFEVVERRCGGNPRRTVLRADTIDEARVAALIVKAREKGRCRHGRNWTVNEIQALPVRCAIRSYAQAKLRPPVDWQGESEVSASRRRHYFRCLASFVAAFPDLVVGDIHDGVADEYHRRASHRAESTRGGDLHTASMAINRGLRDLGCDYSATIAAGRPVASRKPCWEPGWYDRLLLAADGYIFDARGRPVMVARHGTLVPKREPDSVVRHWEAWRRGIPLLGLTGTRSGILPRLTWTEPTGPWIDVFAAILYRKGLHRPDDSPKRGDPIPIPTSLADQIVEWYERDRVRGVTHVCHRADGTPYKNERLDTRVFKRIVRNAGIPVRLWPHLLKSLAYQILNAGGLPRITIAKYLSTTPETLERHYGPEVDVASLEQASAVLADQAAWREAHARVAERRAQFAAARARIEAE